MSEQNRNEAGNDGGSVTVGLPGPYNDDYTHEALHTAHVLLDTWDNHVVDTRCCDEFPDVKEAAEKAVTAMYNVYQLIGQKFRDNDK